MSYNAKQYLAHEERLSGPSVIVRGTQRRYTETSMAAKNRWLDGLTAEQRVQLAREAEEEQRKNDYRQ